MRARGRDSNLRLGLLHRARGEHREDAERGAEQPGRPLPRPRAQTRLRPPVPLLREGRVRSLCMFSVCFGNQILKKVN